MADNESENHGEVGSAMVSYPNGDDEPMDSPADEPGDVESPPGEVDEVDAAEASELVHASRPAPEFAIAGCEVWEHVNLLTLHFRTPEANHNLGCGHRGPKFQRVPVMPQAPRRKCERCFRAAGIIP